MQGLSVCLDRGSAWVHACVWRGGGAGKVDPGFFLAGARAGGGGVTLSTSRGAGGEGHWGFRV